MLSNLITQSYIYNAIKLIFEFKFKIKIWRIPEEGLTSNLDACEAELLGHRRKVLHIEWHPTASNVMFSAGFDHMVCLKFFGCSIK